MYLPIQTVVTAGDLRRLEESRMPPPSESSQLVVELRRTIENLQVCFYIREMFILSFMIKT